MLCLLLLQLFQSPLFLHAQDVIAEPFPIHLLLHSLLVLSSLLVCSGCMHTSLSHLLERGLLLLLFESFLLIFLLKKLEHLLFYLLVLLPLGLNLVLLEEELRVELVAVEIRSHLQLQLIILLLLNS